MTCKYGDPTCPCQDGDKCHYERDGGTPAWHVLPDYVLAAVAAEREVCAQIAESLTIKIGDGPAIKAKDGDWIADAIRERGRG